MEWCVSRNMNEREREIRKGEKGQILLGQACSTVLLCAVKEWGDGAGEEE